MSALGSSLSIDAQSDDAESLALEAAGAVQGRLAADVALDRGLIEGSEGNPGGVDEFELGGLRPAHQGDPGEVGHRACRNRL